MRAIIDLERYPIDDLESQGAKTLIEKCRQDLREDGMFNLTAFIRPEALATCVRELTPKLKTESYEHHQIHNIYFKNCVDGVGTDHPALKRHETRNRKICADQIPQTIILKVYEWPAMASFLSKVMAKERLFVMDDPLARVNVFNYRAGETLNWHFDRSEFTTTVLLQAPDAGGVFEYRNRLRSDDDPNYEGVARLLAGKDDEVKQVHLKAGTLNVFKGKNTAHRVTAVEGDSERIIAVLSFYERPHVRFSEEDQLKFYGRIGV